MRLWFACDAWRYTNLFWLIACFIENWRLTCFSSPSQTVFAVVIAKVITVSKAIRQLTGALGESQVVMWCNVQKTNCLWSATPIFLWILVHIWLGQASSAVIWCKPQQRVDGSTVQHNVFCGYIWQSLYIRVGTAAWELLYSWEPAYRSRSQWPRLCIRRWLRVM